ncbi:MAG: single-stranded-DNA-specific exonuclease RecJ, partial [Chloroflexi bacterium]
PALYKDLAQLEPCGEQNPPPLFLSRNVQVVRARAVGSAEAHLKLSLTDGRVVWDAIAFRQGAWLGELPPRLDVVYHLEVNEWNGTRRFQLNVQDLRPGGE